MLHRVTGFAEDLAEPHRYQFQLGQQALELGRGQRGEQVVLIGTLRTGHDRQFTHAGGGMAGTWTGCSVTLRLKVTRNRAGRAPLPRMLDGYLTSFRVPVLMAKCED